ncbi:MAG: hypothetical protein VXW87_03795 [Pseudomonadota bacterium]|nr:hypothetical protein [Pseudomonadota bacterium]
MNKSLTLYASILLLSPLSSAMGFSDMSFYGSIGSVGATFGECDETDGTIGGKTVGGKVRCMSYSRATFSVGAQTTVRDMFTIEGGFTVVDSEKDIISNFAYGADSANSKFFNIEVEPKNRAFLAVGYRFYDAITVGLKTTFLADEFTLQNADENGANTSVNFKSDETEIFPGISFSVDTTYRGFGVGISGAFSMKDVEKTKDKGTDTAPQNIFSTDTPSTLVEGAIKISYQRSQDA